MMKEKNQTSGQWWGGTCLPWFLGGISLGFTVICSVALLILFVVSAFLNAYLGWELLGFEVSVNSKSASGPIQAAIPAPTGTPIAIVLDTSELEQPVSTPMPGPIDATLPTPTMALTTVSTTTSEAASFSLPTPISTESLPETQDSTPVAIAAASESESEGIPTPVSTVSDAGSGTSPESTSIESAAVVPTATPTPVPTSNNSYMPIPLEGERDSRPAPKHADLSLKLREPQSIEGKLSIVTIPGGGSHEPPQLSGVLPPNFVGIYTVHNWDWGCNCKGGLIKNPWGNIALVEIETTPGEPVYIPRRRSDIYQGKYYAVVLYATESSLTFVYAREGTVANAYAVHYQGLQVDPNLLALYRESEGNQLPGLTLDTPVGIATDKLRVAIRDRGTFMDPRSTDWWD